MIIPFNKPFLTGKETSYIQDAVHSGKISGNGKYTKLCQRFFEDRYNFSKCLLTTSCTDALEMASILIDTEPGDEIILPSYTFVSTANAFALRGANLIFADSRTDHPNIDPDQLEQLITDKTKAIVVVHYAGVACDMEKIMSIANKYNIFVIEDAAQAVDSYFNEQSLGSIGHLSAFSFHETKNIISGEGGMLVINDDRFKERAEIIWEKGTNRSAFFRGEVDKYGWVDLGSSFLPSEIISAFLYAQIENLDSIQKKRKEIWNRYYNELSLISKGNFDMPKIPSYAMNNAHMFYIVCNNLDDRNEILKTFKEKGIWAVFHYLGLHSSDYYADKHDGRVLSNCDHYSDCLIRLPFYYELSLEEQNLVINTIKSYFK